MSNGSWKCKSCDLNNSEKDPRCIACFTVNDDLYWECRKCDSLYLQNKKCINCTVSKAEKHKIYPSQLHFSIDPDTEYKKEILISGFSRLALSKCVIIDIIRIILRFYNETMLWNIDCKSMMEYITATAETIQDDRSSVLFPGEFFHNQGIKMRWMLETKKRYDPITDVIKLIRLMLYLPSIASDDIVNIKLYVALYCPENWAMFKRHVDIRHFDTSAYEIGYEQDSYGTPGSCFPFDMRLDYEKYKEFSVYHHIDVLSVKYNDGTEYNKDINMMSNTKYTWNINGELLQFIY